MKLSETNYVIWRQKTKNSICATTASVVRWTRKLENYFKFCQAQIRKCTKLYFDDGRDKNVSLMSFKLFKRKIWGDFFSTFWFKKKGFEEEKKDLSEKKPTFPQLLLNILRIQLEFLGVGGERTRYTLHHPCPTFLDSLYFSFLWNSPRTNIF